MNNDLDLVIRNVEQEVSFEHFEALVHHGSRVNRNFLAHAPHRMIQGVGDSDFFKLFNRPFAERTTRSRDFEEFNFVFALAAFEALENGTVFRVNRRDEGLRIFSKLVPNDRACHHHRFLVRKSHMLAMFNSGNRREAAHSTHQGVDDNVCLRVGSEFAETFHACKNLSAKHDFEFFSRDFVEHANTFDIVLANEFGHLVHAAICSHGIKVEQIGMLLNDVNARGSDRTGGTQENYIFHLKTSIIASFFIKIE